MPIVQLENGMKINFSNPPTPEDIDHVVGDIHKKQATEPFLQGIISKYFTGRFVYNPPEEKKVMTTPDWLGGKVGENYTNYQPYIQKAQELYPELPKGLLETVLMKESSLGVDQRNQGDDLGKYGYLGGHTLTGHYAETLKNKKNDPTLNYALLRKDEAGNPLITGAEDLSTEQAGILATASVLTQLKRNNPDLKDKDLYFQKYATSSDASKPESQAMFDQYYNYFTQK